MLIIHDIIIDVTDNFFKHATMQSNHVYKGNGLLKIYEKHKNKITMILTYQFLQKQDTKQVDFVRHLITFHWLPLSFMCKYI